VPENDEKKRSFPTDPYQAFDESWGPIPTRKKPVQEYVQPLPESPSRWSVLGIVACTLLILTLGIILLYAGAAIIRLIP
jgi:hypothetical protein